MYVHNLSDFYLTTYSVSKGLSDLISNAFPHPRYSEYFMYWQTITSHRFSPFPGSC